MSTLTIVLLVIGVVFVLGAGSCLLLGGVVLLGVAAENADAGASRGTTTPVVTTAPVTTTPPTVLGGDDEPKNDDDTSGTTAPKTGAATTPTSGSGKWMCNGSGWVRVCGFAGVCNNMLMYGTGVGPDRQSAYTMAKNACEANIRARGGAGPCNVACSPNAH